MEILAVILLLLLSAFSYGSETALVTANRLRTEIPTLRSKGSVNAVRHLYDRPEDVLSTTLIGRMLGLVAYGTLLVEAFLPQLMQWIAGPSGTSPGFALLISVLILLAAGSAVFLIFGIMLPGILMRETANHSIFVIARPLRVMIFLLAPLRWAVEAMADLIARTFKINGAATRRLFLREFEWRREDARADTTYADDDGSELLENVLNMADVRVKESMVPRTDIIGISEQSSIQDVMERFVDSGLSKLPVYRDNIDRVVGIVFAHDLFGSPSSIAEIMRPARYVPESKLSKDLLREFLGTGTSIAIVIDEYGGTAGLVTREDLLEELFGDIQDEFDVEEDVLRQIGENLYIVSGRVRVEDLIDRYDLEIEDGDYETVAGFVLEHAGYIPTAREELRIGRLKITILRATTSRIDLMKIEVMPRAYTDEV